MEITGKYIRGEGKKDRVVITQETNCVRGSPTDTVTLGDATTDTHISEVESYTNGTSYNIEIIMNIIMETRQGQWGGGIQPTPQVYPQCQP